MYTEELLDSIERLTLKSFKNYMIDIPGWANSMRNMTDGAYMANGAVQDRAKQDSFIRANFMNEDVMLYIYMNLKELIGLIDSFDKEYYHRSGFVKDIKDWYVLVEFYMTEMAKRGELSGV